jgi:hypothetical protein
MTRAHALLSASGGYRWSICTKSARLEDTFPDKSSWPAQEGTIAHAIADYALRFAVLADQVTIDDVPEIQGLIDHDPETWIDDLASMCRYVQEYCDYVMAIPGERYFEQRVDFSHIVPEGFGTSDCFVIQEKTAHVGDLKFGKGIKVFADGPQMKLYALGALNDYGFIFEGIENIVMHIIQPRLGHVDTCELTVAELNAYGEWIRGRALLAHAGEGEFVAGEHCGFCRAKAVCAARANFNLQLAQEEFGAPCPNADTLSIIQIAELLPQLKQIAKWCGDVEDYALEQGLAGNTPPGYKIVEGRTTRVWPDEVVVAEAMRATGLTNDQIYNMKLIGMTEAEKLLGKKSTVFDLAIRSQGKPALVPVSDKRPELNRANAVSDFSEPVNNGESE